MDDHKAKKSEALAMGADSRDPALAALERYFGYRSFRPGQAEVIHAVMSGRDALAVMPTGAGKSLCYQIPSVLLDGLVLVVSPLISLMGDQVRGLKQAGIRGSYLNSSLTPRQQEVVMARALAGWYDVMYVAPERLQEPRFRAFAAQVGISLLAVDEAHCVSQWGQDFRPAYRGIANFVDCLPTRPPVAALTATATSQVRNDIVDLLRLRQPEVVVCGFDRPNLSLACFELTPKQRERWIVNYVRAHADQSGIVYAVTRKKVDALTESLCNEGIRAVAYHAGYDNETRAEAQHRFVVDDAPVMVATNAFGMGIDKSNVRYVINSGLPLSLEEYYQEAGRAGRDGEPAECYLLWSRGDIRTCHFFIDHTEFAPEIGPSERQTLLNNRERLLSGMIGYAMSDSCLRRRILRYFGQDVREVPLDCGSCSVCTKDTPERYLRASRARAFGGSFAEGTTMPDFDEGYSDVAAFGRRGNKGAFGQASPLVDQGHGGSAVASFDPGGEESEELFSKLRALRKDLARERGIAPYMVFSDATLRDMIRRRPQTLDQMLDVSGVGQKKLERYGQIFLDALNS